MVLLFVTRFEICRFDLISNKDLDSGLDTPKKLLGNIHSRFMGYLDGYSRSKIFIKLDFGRGLLVN